MCVLDATLPRQRLEFATADKSFSAMLAHCKERAGGDGLGTFGMLGVDRANRKMMRHGTELEILRVEQQDDGSIAVELVGTRCFQLVGDPWLQEPGLDAEPTTPAPLSAVAAATEDSEKFIVARVEMQDGAQLLSTVESVELSAESEQILEDSVGEADKQANLQMSTELEALVDSWCDLVVRNGFERKAGQVARIIRDLGDLPDANDPYDRALWVAALINPLPALGVAMEIRPAVLQATSTANALAVVTSGILSSIAHLNTSKPLF